MPIDRETKFGLRVKSTGKWIRPGSSPSSHDSTTMAEEYLFDSKESILELIDWIRYHAKDPTRGPKIQFSEDEVLELVKVKVVYRLHSLREY